MKLHAVRENHLYLKAFKKGERYSGRYCAVYVLKDYAAERLKRANPEKKYINRVGLSVTKKVGGAVVRSRAKRLIREAYRDRERAGLRLGKLIIISARPGIDKKKTADVIRDLDRAFRSLGLMKPDSSG